MSVVSLSTSGNGEDNAKVGFGFHYFAKTTAFERLRGFQKVEELISNSDDPYVVIRLSEKDFWALYNKKSIELAETERIEGQTAVNMYFRNPPKFDANVQHTATPKKSVQRESTPLRDVNQNERKRFLY